MNEPAWGLQRTLLHPGSAQPGARKEAGSGTDSLATRQAREGPFPSSTPGLTGHRAQG